MHTISHLLGKQYPVQLSDRNEIEAKKIVKEIGDLNHVSVFSEELIKNLYHLSEITTDTLDLRKKIFQRIETLYSEKNTTQYSLLYDLIRRNDKEGERLALQFIESGSVAIHSKNGPDQETPLHLACYLGKIDLVRALILNKADINAIGEISCYARNKQITPLSRCVEGFSTKLLDGFTIVRWQTIAQTKDVFDSIFDLLLTNQANPTLGFAVQSPIFNTCIQYRLDFWATKLIDRVDLEATDSLNRRPLHLAIAASLDELAIDLIKRGVKVDALCDKALFSSLEITPLHIAVSRKSTRLVQALLGAGASPNQKAINSTYLKPPLPWYDLEPLTPFKQAVEDDYQEGIDTIVRYAEQEAIELDDVLLSERHFLSGRYADLTKKGYSSLNLRLKTEVAKRKFAVNGCSPLRCRTTNQALVPTLESIFGQLSTRKSPLPSIEPIFKPLIEIILHESQNNLSFTFFFLNQSDLPGKDGCYNVDTKDEIILTTQTDILPVLIHEITHKVAHMIYKSAGCAPNHQCFQNLIDKDLLELEAKECRGGSLLVKHLLQEVKFYDRPKHAGEYLARVPQAAALLALYNPSYTYTQIKQILSETIPSLFDFFENEFLPDCVAFMKSMP